MFCSKCGRENTDTASFCKSCGAALGHANRAGAANVYAAGYSSGPSVPAYVGVGAPRRSLAGPIAKVAAVIAVVAIGVVVAVFAIGGAVASGPRMSAEQVAQDLSGSFDRLFNSDFSSDAILALSGDMISMMPGAAVEAAMKEAGVTNAADLKPLLDDYLSANTLSSFTPYLDKMDMDFSFKVGDRLSSSELDGVNDRFQQLNVDIRATEGYVLPCDLSVTVLEDFEGASKGETHSDSIENMGLVAICVDGKWYLWITSSFSF